MAQINKAGDLLYQKLVKSGIAEFLEKAVKELGEGAISFNELPVVIVRNIDGSLDDRVKVITPVLVGNKRKAVGKSSYGMDYKTYELLINTSEGWRRTGYIVRFVKHH